MPQSLDLVCQIQSRSPRILSSLSRQLFLTSKDEGKPLNRAFQASFVFPPLPFDPPSSCGNGCGSWGEGAIT